MDDDGRNVTPIAPLNIGSALHATPMQDGRIMFSSFESQGLRDQRMWGIWTISPDGEPRTLGIRVFVPNQIMHSQQVFEAISIVIQTGVGEKLFAEIAYLDVSPQLGSADETLSIQNLAQYIEGHKNRC
jgi:hypothetical protein